MVGAGFFEFCIFFIVFMCIEVDCLDGTRAQGRLWISQIQRK